MDGTLIDWHNGIIKPSKEMFEAFELLRQKGFLVMIASGRSYPLITNPLKDFKFDGYILSDGAHIILNDEDIVKKPINQDDVNKAINLAKELSLEYGVFGKDKTYLKEDGEYISFFNRANHDMDLISFDKHDEAYKVVIHCNEVTKQEVVSKLDYFNQGIEEDYFIEFRSKQCSKASGLKIILEKTGIDVKNTYFFGDGFNDVEIFKMVGHPYVMANANEDLYKYGTVCKSVYEDGVNHQVRQLLQEL